MKGGPGWVGDVGLVDGVAAAGTEFSVRVHNRMASTRCGSCGRRAGESREHMVVFMALERGRSDEGSLLLW